jgi:phage terminase large subunit-like protein
VHFHGKYVLALDPARGGVGRDDYTACIVHFDGETLVVDKFHTFLADFEINGKKEVSIQAVEDWIREHHKLYNFDSIVLDQYNSSATIQSLAADFPIEELTWSVSSKMKAFSKMKELFNAGLVDIYNHEKAIKQLKNLSVVYKASGQWSISGGKEVGVDDYAFALAAAMLQASKDDDLNWINSLIR